MGEPRKHTLVPTATKICRPPRIEPTQNLTRNDNCIILGSPALWIFPNPDVPATLDPGALKCGLFSRSKKSPRNCALTRNVRASDQSKLNSPGDRSMFLGLSPARRERECRRVEPRSQILRTRSVARQVRIAQNVRPIQADPAQRTVLPRGHVDGQPLCHVQIPLVCQPPNTARTARALVLNPGRLYTVQNEKLCGVSRSERP